MKLPDIRIRDPFVLPVKETGAYYLFGSTDEATWEGPGVGFECYRSTDLADWKGPIAAFRPPEGFWATTHFWAPEVFAYDGRYFMFASFSAAEGYRGTQILAADRPEGPYAPWGDRPVTPAHWQCLDGTLHVDAEGNPWIVLCHEWVQIHNGAICARRLSADLRLPVGPPVFLFNASDAPWVRSIGITQPQETADAGIVGRRFPMYVTDGPFLHRTAGGALLLLWSSHGTRGYAMGIARSESGTVLGPWVQDGTPLWEEDGGHGMIFRAFDGRLWLTLHQPNVTPNERPVFRELVEEKNDIRLAS